MLIKTCNTKGAVRFLTVMLLLASVSLGLSLQKKKESFWQRLLRFAGISATPSAQKAPDDGAIAGDIWLVRVDSADRLRLTNDGGYRSPIFLKGDKSILALKGHDVVKLAFTGGTPNRLFNLKAAVKLVGVNADDPDSILILLEGQDGHPVLGVLSLKSGQVTKMSPDGEDQEFRRALAHAQGWERVYGTTRVYVKNEVKNDLAGSLEWSDVYLKHSKTEPKNLSQSDGINCGQPSLSQDGRHVVYIKAQN